jgi:ring-1,2-phenylacetyl-CoA epoxidase subunit PaaB
MTDTQWARFEVFEQKEPGQPHRNAGTVHAPDAELALQNARDVFVRRPNCASLWVVPASAIFTRTAEQLAAEPAAPGIPEAGLVETYEVFQKHSQRHSEAFVSHLGQLEALSPLDALRQARLSFGETPGFVWWVVPARAITRSAVGDPPSWFEPARDKGYRQPGEYPVLTQMRAVKLPAPAGNPSEEA